MKKLYLAEICKIKRMKMTYVAYIGILFSMIISSVQLLGRIQDATFEQLASMFTYNNVLLVLPFCLSLIGGYIIDREYTQNTQKNLFTIPVRWGRVIKAKVLVAFSLSIWIGLFSNIVLILTGMVMNCSQIAITDIWKIVISNFISPVCVLVGTLPIILWFSKAKGKYLWGATLSLLLCCQWKGCKLAPYNILLFIYTMRFNIYYCAEDTIFLPCNSALFTSVRHYLCVHV